jgi:hypothetical protein
MTAAEVALTADEREAIAAAVIVARTLPLAARRGHIFAAVERIIAAREAAAEARGAERALYGVADDLRQGRLGIDFAEAADEIDGRAAAARGGAR